MCPQRCGRRWTGSSWSWTPGWSQPWGKVTAGPCPLCGKLFLVCMTIKQWKVFINIPLISADIKSIKEVLNLSGADLQRLMKLSSADAECLLKTVSHSLRRNCMLTGNTINTKNVLKILSLGEDTVLVPHWCNDMILKMKRVLVML